jgi:hypothetical protein
MQLLDVKIRGTYSYHTWTIWPEEVSHSTCDSQGCLTDNGARPLGDEYRQRKWKGTLCLKYRWRQFLIISASGRARLTYETKFFRITLACRLLSPVCFSVAADVFQNQTQTHIFTLTAGAVCLSKTYNSIRPYPLSQHRHLNMNLHFLSQPTKACKERQIH